MSQQFQNKPNPRDLFEDGINAVNFDDVAEDLGYSKKEQEYVVKRLLKLEEEKYAKEEAAKEKAEAQKKKQKKRNIVGAAAVVVSLAAVLGGVIAYNVTNTNTRTAPTTVQTVDDEVYWYDDSTSEFKPYILSETDEYVTLRYNYRIRNTSESDPENYEEAVFYTEIEENPELEGQILYTADGENYLTLDELMKLERWDLDDGYCWNYSEYAGVTYTYVDDNDAWSAPLFLNIRIPSDYEIKTDEDGYWEYGSEPIEITTHAYNSYGDLLDDVVD